MRNLCLAVFAMLALASCTATPRAYRGIELGQARAEAMIAVDRLWSTNFETRCWPSYRDYAQNTPDHTGGRRTRDLLQYYCFADEDRWRIWYREDPNSHMITSVDVLLTDDRVASIKVETNLYIDW